MQANRSQTDLSLAWAKWVIIHRYISAFDMPHPFISSSPEWEEWMKWPWGKTGNHTSRLESFSVAMSSGAVLMICVEPPNFKTEIIWLKFDTSSDSKIKDLNATIICKFFHKDNKRCGALWGRIEHHTILLFRSYYYFINRRSIC